MASTKLIHGSVWGTWRGASRGEEKDSVAKRFNEKYGPKLVSTNLDNPFAIYILTRKLWDGVTVNCSFVDHRYHP